jgi:hypothetical protein
MMDWEILSSSGARLQILRACAEGASAPERPSYSDYFPRLGGRLGRGQTAFAQSA